MKNTLKRCISALLAAGTLLALAAPTAMAEDERRTPSGIKFADLEKKFDDEFNFDKYATDPVEYYAGFEAVVFCGDEIVYEGYFGETDRERHIPCGEDSVFEWGSISKTMTWVSAMQLWEQGRLDLDADIRDYLPDGFLRYLRYDEPITMQNLMDHTGGWCETTYNISTTDSSKLTTLAEALQETEPAQVNRPGEVVSYSNWGAALAAYVVECVSGMDYADYVHENIFDRLGMEHTSIAADFSDNEWVLKAEIQDQDGDTQATGYASEKVGAGNINKTSALENAETSAVGRALGFLGVGIAASIASADEVTNAAAQLAEIQMREALATAAEKRTLNDLCKKLGQDPLQIARQAGWTSGPLTVEQHGKAMIILQDIEESTEWMRNE